MMMATCLGVFVKSICFSKLQSIQLIINNALLFEKLRFTFSTFRIGYFFINIVSEI